MFPDVSKTCINKILTDHLGYAKVCARWVLRMHKIDHEQQRVKTACEFLQDYETVGEEFMDVENIGRYPRFYRLKDQYVNSSEIISVK